MPTFNSKGVSIQVSVARLAQTTTTLDIHSPGLIEQIEKGFVEDSISGTLFEYPVHANVEGEGQLLQFLGDSVPFHMRHVGKNFFDINVQKNRTIRPKRVPEGVDVSVNPWNIYPTTLLV